MNFATISFNLVNFLLSLRKERMPLHSLFFLLNYNLIFLMVLRVVMVFWLWYHRNSRFLIFWHAPNFTFFFWFCRITIFWKFTCYIIDVQKTEKIEHVKFLKGTNYGFNGFDTPFSRNLSDLSTFVVDCIFLSFYSDEILSLITGVNGLLWRNKRVYILVWVDIWWFSWLWN